MLVQTLSFMCLFVASLLAGMSHYGRNMSPILSAIEAGLVVLNLGLAIRGFVLHAVRITFRERS